MKWNEIICLHIHHLCEDLCATKFFLHGELEEIWSLYLQLISIMINITMIHVKDFSRVAHYLNHEIGKILYNAFIMSIFDDSFLIWTYHGRGYQTIRQIVS